MKKLWNNLSANISGNISAPGVEAPKNASKPASSANPAGHASPALATAGQQGFIRLTLETARKLRWYDKDDLTGLIRIHLREKRELESTVSALRRALLRAGVTEAQLDVEVKAGLAYMERMQEQDDFIHQVLLVSALGEVESLRGKHAELQRELDELRSRSDLQEGSGAASGRHLFNLEEDQACGVVGPLPVDLAQRLTSAMESCESAMAAASASARKLRSAEQDFSAAELTAAVESAVSLVTAQRHTAAHRRGSSSRTRTPVAAQPMRTDGWGWDDADDAETPALRDGGLVGATEEQSVDRVDDAECGGGHPSTVALLAKLQWLERERTANADQIQELQQQLLEAQTAAAKAGALAAAAAKAQEQTSNLSAALELAQSEAAAARAALKVTEEQLAQRSQEMRRLQQTAQGADSLARLQEVCLEAEERAADASRQLSVANAKLSKADTVVKDKNKQIEQLQAEVTSLSTQLKQVQSATIQHGTAASSSKAAGVPPSQHHQQAALEQQVRNLEEALSAAQRELATARATLAAAQAKLHSCEAREAKLMVEVRELESVATERDSLAAEVVALRDKLAEGRVDRSQQEHYKKMAHELDARRTNLEEEHLVLGQLVTQLDSKLRDAQQRAQTADAAVQAAEARLRAVQASVVAEVEQRLASAATNRALWPAPARDEVSRLESRLESLTVSLAACQSQLRDEASRVAEAEQRQADLSRHVKALQVELNRAHTEAEQAAAELRCAVEQAQQEVEIARASARRAETERLAAVKSAAAATATATAMHAQQGGAANGALKWQVQNVVGGGSLYGVSDSDQPEMVRVASAHSLASQGVLLNHTLPYLPGDPDPAPRGPFTTAYLEHRSSTHPQGEGSEDQSASASVSRRPSSLSLGDRSDSHNPALPAAGSRAAASSSAASSTKGRVLEGVDILYLKNVVLKFLEAALAGRIPERDALLPAVATLLQATPSEFQVLKKVVTNTTPASAQVLSWGMKLPNFVGLG